MIINTTKTIYNVKLTNAYLNGYTYQPLPKTTLNEKFDIGLNLTSKSYPKINLLTIGNGLPFFGDILNLKSSSHTPLDAALYNHLPFYLRKKSEINEHPLLDNYRLVKSIVMDGEEYITAYGLRLPEPFFNYDIEALRDIDSDYINLSEINTLDHNFLEPDYNFNTDMKKYTNNTFVTDIVKYNVVIANNYYTELINVFNTLKLDPIITEIGVCSSSEVETTNIVNNSVTRLECINTQINYFLDVNINVLDTMYENLLKLVISIGGMELLKVKI